eukprot:TRINITY_DN12802_c0_g1_i1.p1 TRINITY_DN12802_c0_g1~~TRINITY_DN12802_c0_g1_i1.p1  ORF type:complete len:127 (-),score=18.70 TRINITY_DN12802_c0_g1_i1:3-383(-)
MCIRDRYWQSLSEKLTQFETSTTPKRKMAPVIKERDTSGLKKKIEELRLLLDKERNKHKKELDQVLTQIQDLSLRAKGLAQVNRINSYKLKDLSKIKRITITKVKSKKSFRAVSYTHLTLPTNREV